MNARQMGHKGGLSRSEAKRVAARRNGMRGGRPRMVEQFARELRELHAQLAPVLPEVDPGDLSLILDCLLRPPERRVIFIFRREDGRYVF